MKTTMSATKKLQRIAFRAAMQTSRKVWAISEIARWINSDVKHAKSLIACLASRGKLDAQLAGRVVIFASKLA